MDHNVTNDLKLLSKEFPELFHYTNISAFENIYKTQQLWPTHYEDLNDTTEFKRFKKNVCDYIRPIIRDHFVRKMNGSKENTMAVNSHGGIDDVVDQEAEKLLDQVHRLTFSKNFYKETFVSSFCAHTQQTYESKHGLLSQWRGYGEDGGIAIVLDTYQVGKLLHYENECISQLQFFTMAPVIYDDDDEGIKKAFKNVFENYPKVLKKLYSNEEPGNERKALKLIGAMHKHFLLGSILVKHRAFHEENEFRIVLSPNTVDTDPPYDADIPKLKKEIRYRLKGNSEARYITLFGNSPLPIKRVIIGPSRIQNFNYHRIKDMLGKSPKIDVSNIPLLW